MNEGGFRVRGRREEEPGGVARGVGGGRKFPYTSVDDSIAV